MKILSLNTLRPEKSISYKDMDGTRIIMAVWPFFMHDKGEDMLVPANSAILDEYVISVINGFIEMTDEGAAYGHEPLFLLEINYRLEFTSNRLLSIMFHHYTFEGIHICQVHSPLLVLPTYIFITITG